MHAAVSDAEALQVLRFLARIRDALSVFRRRFYEDATPPRVDFDVEVQGYLTGVSISAWLEAERGAHIQCWSLDIIYRDGSWAVDAMVTVDNEQLRNRPSPRTIRTFSEVEAAVFEVLEELTSIACLV